MSKRKNLNQGTFNDSICGSLHIFLGKKARQNKRPSTKVHQASVINKRRLNIIGVKGYGCTIKVVILRWCPNITSTAKRQISIPAFKNKLMWMEGKSFTALFTLFGSYRNARPELCVSPSSQFLLMYNGAKWDVNVHISAYHPKAAADDQISKSKYCCSGNVTVLFLTLNMN